MLKKTLSRAGNQKGLTLAEMVIVMAIMTVLTIIVAQVTVNTIKAMVVGTSQNIAQSSAEMVMNKIAEDLRQAGSESDFKHIHSGSSMSTIQFTRFQRNMDAFSPSSTDLNFDTACYAFHPPIGTDPWDPSYRPGYISGGTGPGDGSGCTNMYKLTDPGVDIRAFGFQYCRPTDDGSGDTGQYDCSNTTIDNANLANYLNDEVVDITQSAACVWLVKMTVTYARRMKAASSSMHPDMKNITHMYQTSVMLRNPFYMSLISNRDDDKYIDCCDEDYGAETNINWCPKRSR